jgi:hypothetical protein
MLSLTLHAKQKTDYVHAEDAEAAPMVPIRFLARGLGLFFKGSVTSLTS